MYQLTVSFSKISWKPTSLIRISDTGCKQRRTARSVCIGLSSDIVYIDISLLHVYNYNYIIII